MNVFMDACLMSWSTCKLLKSTTSGSMHHMGGHMFTALHACYHRSQGLPFCVAGTGDLLALFRCISCRYCFGTDVGAPLMLGAPGRVFTSSEVETRLALPPAWRRVCFGSALPPAFDRDARIAISMIITPLQRTVCPALQPEMSRNVQKYSREIYARASEALHCRVHATLMLPLFTEQSRRNPVGVLEVVQVGRTPQAAAGMLRN